MQSLFVGRVFILVSSILVALALLEVVFRLFVFPDWRIVSRIRFEPHPIYNTFQKPNLEIRRYNPPNYNVVNRTNSRGFRDRELGFENDLRGLWIAGMSNSYGGFIEDNEIFARLLETNYGHHNALLASEGHVLPNQVAVMRHLNQQGYRPSMVILELSLNHVLRGYTNGAADLAKPLFVPDAGATKYSGARASEDLAHRVKSLWSRLLSIDFVGIKLRLINNSGFYAWAKVGVNAVPFLRKYTLRLGLRADPALSDNIPISMLSAGHRPERDRLVRELADYTAKIAVWVRQALGADFGVVLLPSKHHMNPDWFARYLAANGRNGENLYAAAPYRALKIALVNRDIPVLSMAEPLIESGVFLNFPDDGHINKGGHAIIAQQLAAWLRDRFGRAPANVR